MNDRAVINKDNIAVVIVTFNPNEKFKTVLRRVREIANRIIIIDNASQDQESIKKLLTSSDIYITLNNNKGIATGLNVGIKYIETHFPDIDWVLTLDQDSIPVSNILQLYAHILECEKNISEIGLIGASYLNESTQQSILYKEDSLLISSGLLHNIKIFKNVGYYFEDFFIDYVDFEYSLRCKSFGYKNFRILHKVLDHSLGIPKRKNLLGIKVSSTNHNAVRRYYMVRNGIWTCKLYWRLFPKEVLKKSINIVSNIVRMLIVDDDRIFKIKAVGRGIKDGITKKPKY